MAENPFEGLFGGGGSAPKGGENPFGGLFDSAPKKPERPKIEPVKVNMLSETIKQLFGVGKERESTLLDTTKKAGKALGSAAGDVVFKLFGGQHAYAPDEGGLTPEQTEFAQRESKNVLANQLLAAADVAAPIPGKTAAARFAAGAGIGAVTGTSRALLEKKDTGTGAKDAAAEAAVTAIASALLPEIGGLVKKGVGKMIPEKIGTTLEEAVPTRAPEAEILPPPPKPVVPGGEGIEAATVITPKEAPQVGVPTEEPIPVRTLQTETPITPTYSEAGAMIPKEGGFTNIKSLPAGNRYAADELASSLSLNSKFLYENATKKGIDLRDYLRRLDGLTEVGDRIKVGDDLMDALKAESPKAVDILGDQTKPGDIRGKIAKTPDELRTMLEDTKKISRGMGVNVFEDAKSGKWAGVFEHASKRYKLGRVRINQGMADELRAEVIAHEVGHAIDSHISGAGTAGKTSGNLTKLFNADESQLKTLDQELREVTKRLVGEDNVASDPRYYNDPKELYARFMQSVMFHPDLIEEAAPTAFKNFVDMVAENPVVADFYKVAKEGMIDKPTNFFYKLRPDFYLDAKQEYEKVLGRYLGTKAWGEEVLYNARRAKVIEDADKLIKSKFKGVKDSPELLFDAAEGVKVSRNGTPEFGTRVYKKVEADAPNKLNETEALKAAGYDEVGETEAGDLLFEKWRKTPEEARLAYESLSPKGKEVINQYTADISEATDVFNRELLKKTFKIDSEIEGYVHHFGFDDQKTSFWKKPFMKERKAGARQLRTEAEGYTKDFRKATQKAITDLSVEKEWNSFINKQLAMVAEPMAPGDAVKKGFVEVAGNLQRGFADPNAARILIAKDGADPLSVLAGKRYQVPKTLYDKYIQARGFSDEMSTTAKVLGSLNRYWQGNILLSAGSASTNMIGGGLQYGGKLMTDFYKDILTGSISMPRARADVAAMFETLIPDAWKAGEGAPTWIYGGNKANFYQQFVDAPSSNKAIDAFLDKGLSGYQAIENYWKKAIINAEKRIVKPSSVNDPEFIKHVADVIDVFAFNYDNVPTWLKSWKQSSLGSGVKPFMTYPYKYAKMLSNMAGGMFDPNIPVTDRIAKAMALGTIMTAYGVFRSTQNKAAETAQVPGEIAADVDQDKLKSIVNARGRLFLGKDAKGNDLYLRTAKYPFMNVVDVLQEGFKGNWQGVQDTLKDQVGTIGPIGDLGLSLIGRPDEFDKYKTKPVIAAEAAASYIPLGRLIKGLADYLDPKARKFPETIGQVFGQYLPSTDVGFLDRVRPEEQTAQIPYPPGIRAGSRTTEDVTVPKNKADVLWRELGGVVLKRVNPEWYKRFIERQAENAQEARDKAIRDQLRGK